MKDYEQKNYWYSQPDIFIFRIKLVIYHDVITKIPTLGQLIKRVAKIYAYVIYNARCS